MAARAQPAPPDFWANAERFGGLYAELQAVVQRASGEVPVRVLPTRAAASDVERALQDTLGCEAEVLVVVDPADLPKSWATVDIFAEQIGDAHYRAEAARPRGARGAAASGETPLRLTWGVEMRKAAESLRSDAYITLGDNHLDAKLFPHLHPHGSGSLHSEEDSGGLHRYAQNRLLSLEPSFRKSPVWSFWMMDRLIKSDLYFRQRRRVWCGTRRQSAPARTRPTLESHRSATSTPSSSAASTQGTSPRAEVGGASARRSS